MDQEYPKTWFFWKTEKKTSKKQKLKYAKISNTPFDQRSLIHREAWFPGGPRIPKNPNCLKNGKSHPKCKNSKMSRNMPKLAIPPSTRGLYSIGKRPPCFVRQHQPKKIFLFVWRFETTFKQKCSNLRPLLSITFPQGFRVSKYIGHPGSGGKKTFKWYLKSEQTNRHTDRRTSRLIESIGPEDRCFENLVNFEFSLTIIYYWLAYNLYNIKLSDFVRPVFSPCV